MAFTQLILVSHTMNAKASTKECYVCHHRFPVTEMRRESLKQKSGRSGTSASVGKSGSWRFYTGRNYYRRREIWICDDCKTPFSVSGPRLGKGIFWSFIILIVLLLIFPDEVGGAILDFLRIFFNEDFSLK